MRNEPLVLAELLCLSFGLGVTLGIAKSLLCFLWCVFSYIGKPLKKPPKALFGIVQGIQDFFLCLAAGFFVAVILFYYNHGIARGFSMIAMLVGFLAYRHSIGKLFFSVTDRLGMMIGRGIRTAFLCVTRPMARALIWLFKTTVKPIQFFRHMIKERHIQKYNAMRVEQLRKISIEGFVNI